MNAPVSKQLAWALRSLLKLGTTFWPTSLALSMELVTLLMTLLPRPRGGLWTDSLGPAGPADTQHRDLATERYYTQSATGSACRQQYLIPMM